MTLPKLHVKKWQGKEHDSETLLAACEEVAH